MNKGEFISTLHKITEVELDEGLHKIIKEYICYLSEAERVRNYNLGSLYDRIRRLILALRQVKKQNLCWEHCCELIIKNKEYNINQQEIRELYYYLYLKEVINDKYSEYLRNNPSVLSTRLIGSRVAELFENLVPENFYVKYQNNKAMYLNLKIQNRFIRDILISYLDNIEEHIASTTIKYFIEQFERSLKCEITDIADFNYKTFAYQYRFYRRLSDKFPKYGRTINLLIKFYIFLDLYIAKNHIEHKIFLDSDRIDINYLYRNDFKRHYDRGIEMYYYDSTNLDVKKIKDRILVNPNGYEVFSSVLRSDKYQLYDFSKVDDEEYKKLLKLYFQLNVKVNLNTLYKRIGFIISFLNFIAEFRKEKMVVSISRDKDSLFTVLDLATYRFYLLSKYDNNKTINLALSAVKDFLKVLEENSHVYILPDGYLRLNLLPKQGGRINPISNEDLEKIVAVYKERKSVGTLQDTLEWVVFYTMLTTNLRISEILNLKISNIDFPSKTIYLKRKGGANGLSKYHANDHLLEHLKRCILLTANIRKQARNEIKDQVFLYKTNKGLIQVLKNDTFNKNFTKIVNGIEGVNYYVAYDIRDTFMTNVIKKAKKDGKSLIETHQITGHKDIQTTMKHYVGQTVQEYVEVFYGMKIGFEEIKGEVASDQNQLESLIGSGSETLKMKSVKESSGYCKRNSCKDVDELDCLICNYFVTTVDKIPVFKKLIRKIDFEILKEENSEEKKELLKIKSLYLTYLNKLLEVAEQQKNKADSKIGTS